MKKCWKNECQKKILPPEKIEEVVCSIRKDGKKIATLNGSFDLLHAGHLHIIFEASLVADVLILALNSDASIQRYKRPDRPIIPLQERLAMIASLSCVDYVTWFEETDPREILKRIRPDVHVNGAEYGAECIEASVVRQGGGRLHLVARIPSLSTTEIIEKIRTCDL